MSLISQFQKERDCKLFITTNAGAMGLNLQAADTVINVDLPWNPAMLKMTIALPDESVLENMTKSLAQILGQGLKQG